MKKGILKAIFRGIVKSVLIGNVIIEAIDNAKAKNTIDLTTSEIVEKVEKPHNWISIVTQLIIIAAIVYAFITKQITVEELIKNITY